MTGHGKAERADRGTLQLAGAEAPGVAGAGLRRGAWRQDERTPLHRAAASQYGSEGVVRALVECKADVEARGEVLDGRGRVLRFRIRKGGEGGRSDQYGICGKEGAGAAYDKRGVDCSCYNASPCLQKIVLVVGMSVSSW